METKEQLLKKCDKLVREYVEAYEAIPNSLPRLQVLPGGKDINESYIPTKESMSKYAKAMSRFEKAFHAYNEAIEKLRKVQE